MKNTVNNNAKTKSTFSNFQKAEITKKQQKNVVGGSANIIIEDMIGS